MECPWSTKRCIRFKFDEPEWVIAGPDGKPFLSLAEMGRDSVGSYEQRQVSLHV